MIPQPPTPPPGRIIRGAGGSCCQICGSTEKRAWFGFGRVIGCLQPKCWKYYGYANLPAGQNKSCYLYGAPIRPQPSPPPPPPFFAERDERERLEVLPDIRQIIREELQRHDEEQQRRVKFSVKFPADV